MSVHINSKTAYKMAQELGITGRQQQLVLEALKLSKKPLTRAQLSKRTDIEISSLCGRLNELKKAGKIFTPCSVVGKHKVKNVTYALTKECEQALLVA